jgi:hypothetical protein
MRNDRVEQHRGTESNRTGRNRKGFRLWNPEADGARGTYNRGEFPTGGKLPEWEIYYPQTELSMRDFIIVQYYTVTADAVCE